MPSVIPADLADLFEGGVSILVGTRDASMTPEATRGAGTVLYPDRQRMTVFLPVDVSERAIENLRDNQLVSVGFSSMLDHKTMQVKGKVTEVRDATEAEREIIGRYHVAFCEILSFVGIPRAITRRMNVWPSHAITFEVTDLFHQSPGPNAGVRIGA